MITSYRLSSSISSAGSWCESSNVDTLEVAEPQGSTANLGRGWSGSPRVGELRVTVRNVY